MYVKCYSRRAEIRPSRGRHLLYATAVVVDRPHALELRELPLDDPGAGDVVVDVEWSGVSAGTERLLWSGLMPDFPGMGYPLVPGYESVGRVARGTADGPAEGRRVFVPGATCFGPVRGLFGGTASRLVVPADRVVALPRSLESGTDAADATAEDACLLALAATGAHAIAEGPLPELVVGHGALGRLLARLIVAEGGDAPTVWETDERRLSGSTGYRVVHPDHDDRRDYRRIVDASGADGILDTLVSRSGRGAEIVLAGFYHQPLSLDFPPAFLREIRIRVAAQWTPPDMARVLAAVDDGRLSLDGIVSHRVPAAQAEDAYRRAFEDPMCVKLVLDWRHTA